MWVSNLGDVIRCISHEYIMRVFVNCAARAIKDGNRHNGCEGLAVKPAQATNTLTVLVLIK